jgi:hypothetical protein
VKHAGFEQKSSACKHACARGDGRSSAHRPVLAGQRSDEQLNRAAKRSEVVMDVQFAAETDLPKKSTPPNAHRGAEPRRIDSLRAHSWIRRPRIRARTNAQDSWGSTLPKTDVPKTAYMYRSNKRTAPTFKRAGSVWSSVVHSLRKFLRYRTRRRIRIKRNRATFRFAICSSVHRKSRRQHATRQPWADLRMPYAPTAMRTAISPLSYCHRCI